MAKYIFPGADASCPLYWVMNQFETAGFEVQSVDTIGVHYSATIYRWYQNWLKNKESITKSYGKRWYRYVVFVWFGSC
jgi:cyclopropane fatty-acyl-phospholipid synthase-like methyltransferase